MSDAISYSARQGWPEASSLWLIRRSDFDAPVIDGLSKDDAIRIAGLLNEAVVDGAEMARGRIRDALGL